MFAYAIRRLLYFIPTLLAITMILFLLLNVLPGDAALMAGGDRREVDPQTMERMKKEWGLDKPLHTRYLTYLNGLVRADLGLSFLRREKVNALVADRVWPTLKLATAAMLVAAGLGIPLGFFSALRQGSIIRPGRSC
jgi:ABC-type dipeptide/oligopeptide/nickel transport system permease component